MLLLEMKIVINLTIKNYSPTANGMFYKAQEFDHASRIGPKAFVSEYAVTGKVAGTRSLLAAVAEARFLIGLENNSDLVKMVSYAPLFVVNLASNTVNLKISTKGLDSSVRLSQSKKTVLTSSNVMDENSFSEPKKVVPQQSVLENAGKKMNVKIPPHSVTLFDMLM